MGSREEEGEVKRDGFDSPLSLQVNLPGAFSCVCAKEMRKRRRMIKASYEAEKKEKKEKKK